MTHQLNLDKATQACFNGGMTTTNEFTTRLTVRVRAMTDDRLAEAISTTTSEGAWKDLLLDEWERRFDD